MAAYFRGPSMPDASGDRIARPRTARNCRLPQEENGADAAGEVEIDAEKLSIERLSIGKEEKNSSGGQ